MDIEVIAGKHEEASVVYAEFVDALERENTFDMSRAFTKMLYNHLITLADICWEPEMANTIREDADSMALDHELVSSVTSKYEGMDIAELRRNRMRSLREQNAALEDIIDEMSEIADRIHRKQAVKDMAFSAILGLGIGAALAKKATRR